MFIGHFFAMVEIRNHIDNLLFMENKSFAFLQTNVLSQSYLTETFTRNEAAEQYWKMLKEMN